MAILYPSYEDIKKMTVKPTSGEQALLDFLYNNLSDDFEVYFQPSLNGANFDFAIVRKNGGIVIIEVKDWHLDLYSYKNETTWQVESNGRFFEVLSPFKQAQKYKDELINFYMENSIEYIVTNNIAYASIEICVFFYNAYHDEVEEFLSNNDLPPCTYFLGIDDLNIKIFNRTFSPYFIKGKSKLPESIYQDAHKALRPCTEHSIPGAITTYTKKQLDIILRFNNANRMRLKGAAGSGKSQVLCKIAANRLKETNNKVLILCFNITLRNYFINLIRKSSPDVNFKKSDVHIQNYHNFIKNQCTNLNINKTGDLTFYDNDNVELFTDHINQFNLGSKIKYDTILIDEVQDFKPNWIKNVLAFLNKNGKVLYCGDIKQDIYQHQDSSKVKTNDIIYTEGCVGRWNELTETFRLPSEMVEFANAYAKKFLPDKNDVLLETNKNAQGSLFSEGEIYYSQIDSFDEECIYKITHSIRNADDFNNETQIGILGMRVMDMRHLYDYFMKKSHNSRKITATFESQELFCRLLCELGFKNYADRIKIQNDIDLERKLDTDDITLLGNMGKRFRKKIESVRRAKKQMFYMNNGSYKMSTIHSFKGWELDNIILIIGSSFAPSVSQSEVTHELIYTAITRAKKRLYIVSIGKTDFDAFINEYKQLDEGEQEIDTTTPNWLQDEPDDHWWGPDETFEQWCSHED